eukprot:GHVS01085158.1.p1 GENE.GHVS01085158.1~~GHVS01085158.1.p1  ORF type:complete len:184 (-),score=5.20 GHVS01085158.1:968-1519(-)
MRTRQWKRRLSESSSELPSTQRMRRKQEKATRLIDAILHPLAKNQYSSWDIMACTGFLVSVQTVVKAGYFFLREVWDSNKSTGSHALNKRLLKKLRGHLSTSALQDLRQLRTIIQSNPHRKLWLHDGHYIVWDRKSFTSNNTIRCHHTVTTDSSSFAWGGYWTNSNENIVSTQSTRHGPDAKS